MISSLLELNSSPTQQRIPKTECRGLVAEFEDNDNKLFEVRVDYTVELYDGYNFYDRTCCDFDYEVEGTPNISRADLIHWIKDEIAHHEGYKIYFY